MDTSTIPASYAVIAAMITPAFFLAAVGSLLISSNNRLARVVDRMRIEIQRLHETHGDARPELKARILIHRRRSYLVLGALRLLYGSLSAFVGTSIAIAVDAAVLDNRMIWLPTALTVIGVLLVFAASLCLGHEARLGVPTLHRELENELALERQRPRGGLPRGLVDPAQAAHEEAVVAQLVDRVVDVTQGGVRRLLAHPGKDVRRPAAGQLLDRAHVQVAVVEIPLQLGH